MRAGPPVLHDVRARLSVAQGDESYAIIRLDFLTGKKKAPSGFDMAQLTRDLEEINHVPASRAAFGTKKL